MLLQYCSFAPQKYFLVRATSASGTLQNYSTTIEINFGDFVQTKFYQNKFSTLESYFVTKDKVKAMEGSPNCMTTSISFSKDGMKKFRNLLNCATNAII